MQDVDIATVTNMRTRLEEKQGTRVFLLFEAYQRLTTKSKNLSLQDVWTKQLMSVRGVSAEKASKIVMRYPTMRR